MKTLLRKVVEAAGVEPAARFCKQLTIQSVIVVQTGGAIGVGLAAFPASAGAQATGLIVSDDALLPATQIAPSPFAALVESKPALPAPSGSPWWATSLAVAGPLADGASTVYAMRQSGDEARVVEGNWIFGQDATAGQIMAFKVGQAALMGLAVHYGGKHNRKLAIGAALVQFGINSFVVSSNLRNAETAKRLNR